MVQTRILLVTLAGLAALSCGQASSPISPSAPPGLRALFRPGTYMLSITGFDAIFTETGIAPACPGISSAGISGVLVEVSLTLERNEWRARPAGPTGGAFEIQLAAGPLVPGGPGGGPGVSGVASGVAISSLPMPPFQVVQDSHVTFGGAVASAEVSLTGGASQDGRAAGGYVMGQLVFGNSAGARVLCNPGTVRWFLSIRD